MKWFGLHFFWQIPIFSGVVLTNCLSENWQQKYLLLEPNDSLSIFHQNILVEAKLTKKI